MLHEARDRQKFLSDAQYLRDMQHKVESEYQVSTGNGTYLPPLLAVLGENPADRISTCI